MKKGQKLVIGNWKMNPETIEKAREISFSFKKKLKSLREVKTVICPPYIYLNELNKIFYDYLNIYLGSQDIFWQEKGSFTGQISPLMIKNLNVEFVILGHSELRNLGETDDDINKKVLICLKNKLSVILCIGENERDKEGNYLSVLREQIKNSLNNVKKNDLNRIHIAYEPIWAIGNKDNISINGRDLHQSSLFVRKVISEMYGQPRAMSISIIYGGSVNTANAKELISEGGIQGFLVGRQSLEPDSFSEIIKIVSKN